MLKINKKQGANIVISDIFGISIMIMLENMLDDPEMEPDVREEFLGDIRREAGNVNIINDGKLYCDPVWQTEALTNIIKNCVEHSSGVGKRMLR